MLLLSLAAAPTRRRTAAGMAGSPRHPPLGRRGAIRQRMRRRRRAGRPSRTAIRRRRALPLIASSRIRPARATHARGTAITTARAMGWTARGAMPTAAMAQLPPMAARTRFATSSRASSRPTRAWARSRSLCVRCSVPEWWIRSQRLAAPPTRYLLPASPRASTTRTSLSSSQTTSRRPRRMRSRLSQAAYPATMFGTHPCRVSCLLRRCRSARVSRASRARPYTSTATRATPSRASRAPATRHRRRRRPEGIGRLEEGAAAPPPIRTRAIRSRGSRIAVRLVARLEVP